MLLSLLLSMLSPKSRYGETKMPRTESRDSSCHQKSILLHLVIVFVVLFKGIFILMLLFFVVKLLKKKPKDAAEHKAETGT